MSEIRWLRYWPLHKPIPRGWRPAGSLEGTNHGHFALIIEKEPGFYARVKGALKTSWQKIASRFHR